MGQPAIREMPGSYPRRTEDRPCCEALRPAGPARLYRLAHVGRGEAAQHLRGGEDPRRAVRAKGEELGAKLLDPLASVQPPQLPHLHLRVALGLALVPIRHFDLDQQVRPDLLVGVLPPGEEPAAAPRRPAGLSVHGRFAPAPSRRRRACVRHEDAPYPGAFARGVPGAVQGDLSALREDMRGVLATKGMNRRPVVVLPAGSEAAPGRVVIGLGSARRTSVAGTRG